MKVVVRDEARRMIVPVIPLERPKERKLTKDASLTFKLRSTPDDVDSPTYELTIPYFGSGTPEEYLLWQRDLDKVIVGQNVEEGPAKYSLARRVLTGDALAAFNTAAQTYLPEMDEYSFEYTMMSLTEHVFPKRALQTQKRYKRRFLWKTREVTVRDFMVRLQEMNLYLQKFPEYVPGKELPEDELLDIAEFASPSSWQKAMVMHGFDPIVHTSAEFVEFCERLEFTESADFYNSEAKLQTNPKGGSGTIWSAKSTVRGNISRSFNRNQNHKRKNYDVPPQERWCEYHHVNGHDTGECKVMLEQAKRMRLSFEASRRRGINNGNGQNKVWIRPKNAENGNGQNEHNWQTANNSNGANSRSGRPMKAIFSERKPQQKRKSNYTIESGEAADQLVQLKDDDLEACLCTEFDNISIDDINAGVRDE